MPCRRPFVGPGAHKIRATVRRGRSWDDDGVGRGARAWLAVGGEVESDVERSAGPCASGEHGQRAALAADAQPRLAMTVLAATRPVGHALSSASAAGRRCRGRWRRAATPVVPGREPGGPVPAYAAPSRRPVRRGRTAHRRRLGGSARRRRAASARRRLQRRQRVGGVVEPVGLGRPADDAVDGERVGFMLLSLGVACRWARRTSVMTLRGSGAVTSRPPGGRRRRHRRPHRPIGAHLREGPLWGK